MMSISVIIPAYNADATLTEALDSVTAQNVPIQDVIVVDDASTDRTAERFAAWADTHADLHPTLIRQPRNQGPAAARNTGIRASTGEWIAFLDSDDAWLPGKLTRQMQAAASHPEAALLCGATVPLVAEHQDEPMGGRTVGESCVGLADSPLPPARPEPATGLTALSLDTFVTHNPVATSTVMVKRTALQQAGLFDEQFRGPEDYDLWMRIAALRPCLQLAVPLSQYRLTKGSLSMDDRTFLPQVLGVLRKAFAPTGVLHRYRRQRRQAYAEKYASASWMASNRGARLTALGHLLHSWVLSPLAIPRERDHDRSLRLKLLLRYVSHLLSIPRAK